LLVSSKFNIRAAEPAKVDPAPPTAEPAKTEPAAAEPAKTEPAAAEPAKTEPGKTAPKKKTDTAKTEPAKPDPTKTDAKKDDSKYDTQSDEFFFKHDEIVVPMVMRSAVKCWEALTPEKKKAFHRNQTIVIKFKQRIVNGTVTMNTGEVERSSIKDPALEKCFYDQVLATTWHDDKLPDWEQDDEVKISPRVLKKYTRENIEYVGAEAPATPTYLTREQLDKDFDKNYKE
jgi:hypothetical protein